MTRTAPIALLLLGLAACRSGGAGEDHGHDHGEADARYTTTITHFGERTELFVEFPALVRGMDSPFAAHLNDLERFKPLAAGRVTVLLEGGGAPVERFESDAPTTAGIFRPVVRPAHAGSRRLVLLLEAPGAADRHDLGELLVHADAAEAEAADAPEEDAGLVTFLKEQQWRTDFATAPAEEAALRPAVPANGVLRARPDGDGRMVAPASGRLVAAAGAFPVLGRAVRAGEVLAALAPRVGGDTDPATLALAVTQARLDVEASRRELVRAEELAAAEAVPEKRVAEARRDAADAEARLAAAESRRRRYEGRGQAAGGRVALRSPISGVVAAVHAGPGAFVEEGRELFHVVDLDRLWLEVAIPEADIGRAGQPSGAWFEVDGFDRPFEVDPAKGGRVVGVGGVVDPQTRTVPVVFELPNPGRALRVGMSARVHVLAGEPQHGVVIPASAVVDDGAEPVVFVEVSGERFERRPVALGIRDRGRVQVRSGVEAGERVVTRGAWQVRLAAASGAIPAHGHAH